MKQFFFLPFFFLLSFIVCRSISIAIVQIHEIFYLNTFVGKRFLLQTTLLLGSAEICIYFFAGRRNKIVNKMYKISHFVFYLKTCLNHTNCEIFIPNKKQIPAVQHISMFYLKFNLSASVTTAIQPRIQWQDLTKTSLQIMAM